MTSVAMKAGGDIAPAVITRAGNGEGNKAISRARPKFPRARGRKERRAPIRG